MDEPISIKKLKLELSDLEAKITRLEQQLSKETQNPTCTDEIQRRFLALQLGYMKCYADVLDNRVCYDTIKHHAETSKEEK